MLENTFNKCLEMFQVFFNKNRPSIIVKLQGGLGNQIFQWAYAKHLSIKYSTDLCLDLSFFDLNLPHITKRVFCLNELPNLDMNKIQFKNLPENSVEKNSLVLVNDDFSYKKHVFKNHFKYYLSGYWQSEKYFIGSQEVIRRELSPSGEIINNLKNKFPIDGDNVSLHIRRTDYLTSNGLHPVQPLSYYEKALEAIGPFKKLFIFSDDTDWCKNNLNFESMIFVDGISDVESLFLMSMCKNNIIANSSFSWWGAWLNSNPHKKVIAPSKWFGSDYGLNHFDNIPVAWFKIW